MAAVIIGVALALMVLATPVAAAITFKPAGSIPSKYTTGSVADRLKAFGFGTGNVQDKLASLSIIKNMKFASPPATPMPNPGEWAFKQPWDEGLFMPVASTDCNC